MVGEISNLSSVGQSILSKAGFSYKDVPVGVRVQEEMAANTEYAIQHLAALGHDTSFFSGAAKIMSACANTHRLAALGHLEGGICVAPEPVIAQPAVKSVTQRVK